MKLQQLQEDKYDANKPIKYEFAFIPISNIVAYSEYDGEVGYGGANQLFFDNGILVRKEDEKMFRRNVEKSGANSDDFDLNDE